MEGLGFCAFPVVCFQTPSDKEHFLKKIGPKEPHYYGHRLRLRERFLKSGLAGLADYEVVEMLLTLAIPRKDVKERAKALIKQFGNLRGILDAPIEEVKKIDGLGEVAPVVLRMIREILSLYLQQGIEKQEVLSDPNRLHEFWRVKIGSHSNEVFMVAYLDSAYRLLRDGVEELEEGTIDRAAVYPRKVVKAAVRRGAATLVLAHNHPNGDLRPSEQDKLITKALVLAAAAVQIKVLDHLIVTPDSVFSFRREGLL
jgi:DNA repair protein RadC